MSKHQNRDKFSTIIDFLTFNMKCLLAFCVGLICFGAALFFWGAKDGNMSISIFGQSIETSSLGVSIIFIGAITFMIVIIRILKSLDHAIKN